MSSHEGHGVKLLFAIVAEFAVTARMQTAWALCWGQGPKPT